MFEEAFNQGYPQELKHFIACVRDDTQPVVTGEDGRAVLELMLRRVPLGPDRAEGPAAVPADRTARPVDLWLGGPGAIDEPAAIRLRAPRGPTASATFWRDRLRTNPRLKICLPSGLTPNPIYAEMVRSVAAGRGHVRASLGLRPGRVRRAAAGRSRPREARGRAPSDRRGRPAGGCVSLSWTRTRPTSTRHCRALRSRDRRRLRPGPAGDRPERAPRDERARLAGPKPHAPRRAPRHDDRVVGALLHAPGTCRDGESPSVCSRSWRSKRSGCSPPAPARRRSRSAWSSGEIDERVPASLLRRHANCSLFVDAEAGALL